MTRKLITGLALGLALASLPALAPQSAHATTLTQLTHEQMTDASDLIVRGTVTEVWAEKQTDGTIWTKAQVEVQSVLKGEASTDAVIVEQLGGVLMNDYQVVAMAARFSVGEEAYFFLETMGSGKVSPVGMYQGKYTVRIDPDSGQEMVVRFALSQDRQYDHRFIPHPPSEQRLMATSLEDTVFARIEKGWDQQPIPGASTERLSRINTVQKGVK